MAQVTDEVTLELVDGSRRTVSASSLREVTDERWAHAHAAALAQKRSELEVATRQAFAREQEQVTASLIVFRQTRCQEQLTASFAERQNACSARVADVGGQLPRLHRFCCPAKQALSCRADHRRPSSPQGARRTQSAARECARRLRAAHGWSVQP